MALQKHMWLPGIRNWPWERARTEKKVGSSKNCIMQIRLSHAASPQTIPEPQWLPQQGPCLALSSGDNTLSSFQGQGWRSSFHLEPSILSWKREKGESRTTWWGLKFLKCHHYFDSHSLFPGQCQCPGQTWYQQGKKYIHSAETAECLVE